MPKLAPVPFRVKGTDEVTVIEYKADANVGQDGIFSVALDERLNKSALRLSRERKYHDLGIGLKSAPRSSTAECYRVTGKSLDDVRAFIIACAEDELKCEVRTDFVIVYGHSAFAHAAQAKDGSLHPNAHYAGEDGGWIEISTYTNPGSRSEQFYTVGFAASVWKKTTWTRPTGVTAKYERAGNNSHFADQDPATMLNAFVHVYPDFGDGGRLPTGFQEMPYTPEAAIFFYQTMLNIVKLAKSVRDFFGNAPLLLDAIRTGTPLLGAPKA